jgi:hypothetical protein
MATPLDPTTLGITLAVLGMGGTLLTLYAISLIASLLKRLFPVPPPPVEPTDGSAGTG